MKTMLKISIGLNVVLAGGLIFMLLQKPAANPAPPVVAETPPPMAVPAAAAPQNPNRAEPKPFRWSQLAANDYYVFVKNLRAIGCPELTLRAIVTADADALYEKYRHELEQKLSNLDHGSLSGQLASLKAEQTIKAQLQQLPSQETLLIANLLGLQPAPDQMTAAASAPAAQDQGGQSKEEKPVTMPFVFLNVDPAALNLNEEQVQAIADLRQNFVEQIGGTNQNPDDPAYLARWRQAEPLADNMLRLTLGNDGYMKFTLSAQDQESPTP